MTSTYNPMDLTGKVILVTGASSGIGRAIAIECSKLGATCILTARNMERLHETLSSMEGEGHAIIPADLTEADAVAALVEQLPKLDGVSLNAGIVRALLCSYAKMSVIHELFDILYFSVVNLMTSLLKKRKLNKNASIVIMSSIAAFCHAISNGFYGAAKAAVSHYVIDLANELRIRGVRVNSICPGMVVTPLTSDDRGEDFIAKDMERYLHRRYGKPEEIAHLVAYLLSDAAIWITGSQFTIDGGASIR